MFEKNGRFYADWRDKTGKRIRKAFKSPRAALNHEAAQKELAHPKPKARASRSPIFSAPPQQGRKAAPSSTKPPSASSRKLAHSPRTSSPQPTSSKQMTPSGAEVIPIRRKPRSARQ